jgi:hypothetical protein
MAKVISHVHSDGNQNELQNWAIHNLATEPATPVDGQIYYNTVTGLIGWYDGVAGEWKYGGDITDVVGTAPITVSVNPTTGVATVSISPASATDPGSMSAAHYTLVEGATSSNTADTIVKRDTNGDFSAHDITANKVTGLVSPVAGSDAANKDYVDAIAQGLSVKAAVNLATAAALPAYTYDNGTAGVGATITANANGLLTVDGVPVQTGWRIMVKNEGSSLDSPDNGIYVVTATGSGAAPFVLTRATDFDNSPSGTEIAGAFAFVMQGTANADSGWVCITDPPVTVGTTGIQFTQFSGAGSYTAGNGLALTGTVFSVQAADQSINVTGTGVSVNKHPEGAIDILSNLSGTGLAVNTDGTSITINTGNALAVTSAVAKTTYGSVTLGTLAGIVSVNPGLNTTNLTVLVTNAATGNIAQVSVKIVSATQVDFSANGANTLFNVTFVGSAGTAF